jgi:hypothetical protein
LNPEGDEMSHDTLKHYLSAIDDAGGWPLT